ncbi:NAD dependent epimerase/dehydratase family protein [Roseivivax lentus]|uniref:NAD dependent epimerase/dehydratase family protein n=1 Tax=Roseivivax lentus TaxID=633194 RepID=A0A1N7JYF1_9RHOB|nr:NAD-dependent epimerase/dehydratase family protein [Roseivivax lentus]SIS54369.1 NAD dependent epimerase/dehydratase family protein [Roseivivax lentus]
MADSVLVTGGAASIGRHARKALAAAGDIPITFSMFLSDWRDAVRFGSLAKGDLLDRAAIDRAFAEPAPVAVLHYAALSRAGAATKLVTGSSRAAEELGGAPRRPTIPRMIEDARAWQQHGHNAR